MFTRLLTVVLVITNFPMLGMASPIPFGSSKEECIQISIDKYEADSEYIQENLLTDEIPLLNAAQDIHRIELQSCASTMFF